MTRLSEPDSPRPSFPFPRPPVCPGRKIHDSVVAKSCPWLHFTAPLRHLRATLCDRDSRTRHPETRLRQFTSSGMASMNGVLNPPLHSDMMNSSAILSAKRKRDDASENQNHSHAISESKSPGSIDISHEDSQALIRDLIDVLKM